MPASFRTGMVKATGGAPGPKPVAAPFSHKSIAVNSARGRLTDNLHEFGRSAMRTVGVAFFGRPATAARWVSAAKDCSRSRSKRYRPVSAGTASSANHPRNGGPPDAFVSSACRSAAASAGLCAQAARSASAARSPKATGSKQNGSVSEPAGASTAPFSAAQSPTPSGAALDAGSAQSRPRGLAPRGSAALRSPPCQRPRPTPAEVAGQLAASWLRDTGGSAAAAARRSGQMFRRLSGGFGGFPRHKSFSRVGPEAFSGPT